MPVTYLEILIFVIIAGVFVLGYNKRWQEVYEVPKEEYKKANTISALLQKEGIDNKLKTRSTPAFTTKSKYYKMGTSVIMVKKQDKKKAMNLLKQLEKDS